MASAGRMAAGNPAGLFDSFFSTRGDGLGLGLSICRDIAEGYGGAIVAENTTQGAQFLILLPEMEASDDP